MHRRKYLEVPAFRQPVRDGVATRAPLPPVQNLVLWVGYIRGRTPFRGRRKDPGSFTSPLARFSSATSSPLLTCSSRHPTSDCHLHSVQPVSPWISPSLAEAARSQYECYAKCPHCPFSALFLVALGQMSAQRCPISGMQ